jgi:N-glycosylase/DNA lyase
MARLYLKARPFDWQKLVFAHGWVFLAPYCWQEERQILLRPMRLAAGDNVRVAIAAHAQEGASRVCTSAMTNRPIPATDRSVLRAQIRRILQLDADFSNFHAVCAGDPVLGFVERCKCGGLLRGASAFEDVVKTVCTTNCDWRNTKRMCERLCLLDGDNFPTPEKVLALSEADLAKRTSCGYRAKTIRLVAKLTAEGKLRLDEWAREGEFDRAKASLKEIWGIGPYALNHVLVLLGDYSAIPVDSEVLAYLRKVHFRGKEVSAIEAVKPYGRYGRYAFLAFKFGRMARRFNYIDK